VGLELLCNCRSEVPNLGYMYPQGYICLSEGVHLRLSIENKNMFAYYLISKYLYIYHYIYLYIYTIIKSHYMLMVKFIYE